MVRRRRSERLRQINKPKQNTSKKQNKKKKQVDVVDVSHTDSITDLINNQNLTVDNKQMEEVPEVEISISNDSNQMEVHNTFQFLSKDIQASNDFGGTSKKNHSKSISARSSCPSSSFNITEMANMWNGEDDEFDCVEQSNNTIGGYKVKQESMPILRKILSKHGDIAKNCTVLTMKHRSMLLEMICDIISELQEKKLGRIEEDDLDNMIALVNEIQNAAVEIEWLHKRLVQILEARKTVNESRALIEENKTNGIFIEVAERKLEECEAQKKEVRAIIRSICDKEAVAKVTLARALEESTRIGETIEHAKFKVKRFLRHSMADGLI